LIPPDPERVRRGSSYRCAIVGTVPRVATDDRPRLLAQRSELAYTSRAEEALRDEPEAVTAGEQRELTRRAHDHARQQRIREWRVAHEAITAAVGSFQSAVPVRGPARATVRALLRCCDKLDREVAG
jgi:hypothetical protein